MGNLFILYSALTVFGIGVTLIDFLGILDHAGGHDAGHDGHAGDYADTGGHESAGGADGNHGAGHTDGGGDHGPGGHNDSRGDNAEHDHGSYLSPGDAGVRAVTAVMGLLRTVVYFSLGFGPTGLFAWFTGLSRTGGLVWACVMGSLIAVFARLLRRFIRRDLDSSIKPDEFLMETGVLLLPLEGERISKAAVRQFGRETELYVRCRDPEARLPKGKTVRIVEYDNDVYWIEPLE